MEEEEIYSPEARGLRKQNSPDDRNKKKRSTAADIIDDEFDVQEENIDEAMKEINEQYENANLELDGQEDEYKEEDNAKHSDMEYPDIKEKINQYLVQSTDLLQRKLDKEEKAWDMKFQNYWTNLIDFEMEQNKTEDDQEISNTNVKVYCERLLQHVGRFRKEAIQIFETIVDEMTTPESQK